MAEDHFKDENGEQPASLNIRSEASPIKEALLTKFNKLSAQDQPESSPQNQSWLRHVKGRIAKTVEEKYTEYKAEKDAKRAQTTGQDNDSSDGSDLISTSGESGLTHSLSEGVLTSTAKDLKPSQSFDQWPSEADYDEEPATPTPSEPIATPTVVVDATLDDSTMPNATPTRKRFFPSFQSLRSSPAKAELDDVTSTSAPGPSSTPVVPSPAQTGTPTRSLKSRMWNLMGKTPTGSPAPKSESSEPLVSVSMKELCGSPLAEEPFSGLDITTVAPADLDANDSDIETAVEADEHFKFEPSTPEELGTPDVDDVDAEIIEVPDQADRLNDSMQYWWTAVLPVCGLLLLQILPFPAWLIGFVTGVLIGVPGACYVTWYFMKDADASPVTPFIDNIKQKVAKKPAIIVQEELERKFTWMNLWPTRKGPYDPLTYDVRRTSSVRIMLHGPWIEMRFPKRNLPLRRMYDDVEPKKVEYHDQVEVIDLSTCSIDLLPENLPSKRYAFSRIFNDDFFLEFQK